MPKQIPIAAIMQTIPITVRFPIHRKPMDFFFFMFFLSPNEKSTVVFNSAFRWA